MASSKGVRDHEGGQRSGLTFRCYYCNVYSAEPAGPVPSQLCNDSAGMVARNKLHCLITESLPLRSSLAS